MSEQLRRLEPEDRSLSPRAQLRLWLREEITNCTEIHRPALVEQAVDRFGDDATFMDTFLRQSLHPVVYELASPFRS